MKRFACFCLLAAMLALMAPIAALAATQGPLLGPWEVLSGQAGYTPVTRCAYGVVNNKLYLIGGKNTGGTVIGTVQCYDPVTDTYNTDFDPLPTARWLARAAVINGKIYVIGGANAGETTKYTNVDIFDPSQPKGSQWTKGADLPFGISCPIVVAYNNPTPGTGWEIHCYGGDAGTAFPNDHAYLIYNVANNTWANAPLRCPSSIKQSQGALATDMATGDPYIYIISGKSSGNVTQECWRINPGTLKTTSFWDSHVHLVPEKRWLGGVITVTASDSAGNPADYLLFIGGHNNSSDSNSAATTVEAYISGATNNWQKGANAGPDIPSAEARTEVPSVAVLTAPVNGVDTPFVYVAAGAITITTPTKTRVPATNILRAPLYTDHYPASPKAETHIIGAWEDLGVPMPTGRSDVAYGVVNNKLYVIGGTTAINGSTITGANEEFDPAANKWTSKAPMPVPVWGAASAAINGKIYIAGGRSAAQKYENTLQIYDPATDTWQSSTNGDVPAMPTARSNVVGVATSDGLFRVLGGDIGNNGSAKGTSKYEIYDPVNKTWTNMTTPSAPWAFYNAAACAVPMKDTNGNVISDWVYFGTGFSTDWSTECSQVARYDRTTAPQYWGAMAYLPYGGVSSGTFATITDVNGNMWAMYFGGGYAPIPCYDRVWTYHPFGDPDFANVWVEDAYMPTNRNGRPAVAQIGNYVYVAGGKSADKNGGFAMQRATWRGLVGSAAPTDVTTIRDALALRNGANVNITTPKVVTRAFSLNTANQTYFWIEEDDRSSAVRVGPTLKPVAPGNKVTLSGRMSVDPNTGDRTITPTSMTVDASQAYPIPKPIGISNKSIMGGASDVQPGRTGGTGLNNLGMLVHVWGTTSVQTNWYVDYDGRYYFYIDDGSGLMDGTSTDGVPNIGIRVYFAVTAPMLGDACSVTGILTTQSVNGTTIPIILSDEVLTAPDGQPDVAIRDYTYNP